MSKIFDIEDEENEKFYNPEDLYDDTIDDDTCSLCCGEGTLDEFFNDNCPLCKGKGKVPIKPDIDEDYEKSMK